MKEFGSDFHYINCQQPTSHCLSDFYPSANYYVDGRQALIHLYHSQGWQRLWVPEYFCYDVVETLKIAGLEIIFYTDYPDYKDDGRTIDAIHRHFREGDAILRMNYFGLRTFRSSEKIIIPVVEDHTHDLIGGWALKSDADWCVASLRKSLPIPEGGMLWSPVGLKLPKQPDLSEENEQIAATRWEAMRLKTRYLKGEDVDKAVFRKGFVDTEEYFDRAAVCALDQGSKNYLEGFDVWEWYRQKRENWNILQSIKKERLHILRPEDSGCYPFSLVMVFDLEEERNRVRKALIERLVYPAILWNVPPSYYGEISQMSGGVLSIHCDARYTREDILQLKSILESIL